jgi:hypothetical protein
MSLKLRFLLALMVLPLLLAAQERIDLNAIYQIKDEAFTRSKVMEHTFWLTDVHGPRLTNTPAYTKAAEWVMQQLKSWGVENVRLESFDFGRGWTNERFSVHLVEPVYQPMYGFPLAWTPSTDGVVTAEPVHVVVQNEADLEKWKGKLKGKIVLNEAPRAIQPQDRPLMSRYDDKQLADLLMAPEPGAMFGRRAAGSPQNFMQQMTLRRKLTAFWKEEGVAAIVGFGYRNDGGTIAASSGGSRDPKEPATAPMIVVTPEHYNRVVRLLQHNVPVKMEIEVRNTFHEKSLSAANVIAEIPGTRKKDEVVLIGGHLDSWHGGTGAADNAAGSAVMMEAMRILKTLKLPLERTVRIGLWAGEEQGLLGSRAYVKEHLADRTTMKTTKAWENFSVYFNIDNGTGKIRGIYLQGNEAARPVFQSWLAPFKDLGADTVTIRNTSGTDHQSFDAVGLPAFQFIQDPIEYSTRTHHSNMDVYDRVQSADMMQMSAIVTSLVYHAANRPDLVPRKPKPTPQAERRGGPPF